MESRRRANKAKVVGQTEALSAFRKASSSSILLLGNHGRRRGNRFSRVGKRNSTQEIAFPVWESKIPHRKSLFPCGKAKSHTGNRFSCVGNRFSCVSVSLDTDTITIAGPS